MKIHTKMSERQKYDMITCPSLTLYVPRGQSKGELKELMRGVMDEERLR